MVHKGTVLTIDGNQARVAPMDDIEAVSNLYTIPPHMLVDDYEKIAEATTDAALKTLLKEIADKRRLKKGDTVAFAGFSDYSGVIIAKM
ncbi:MAG: hypothetical protein HDR21_13835 [Lachnospiraceae bacterium]|nr:hypothetical protein [Lachnospiraceae bacterium]